MDRKYWIVISVLTIFGHSALGQGSGTTQILGAGLTGTAGAYNHLTSTVGANANRTAAQQLYQQGESDKAAGLSTWPPNIGLLSKALNEAQQGVQADDQSHQLAQAALGGTSTGDNSGIYSANNYNAMNNDGLQNMLNTSAPLWPQVHQDLQSAGMQLTENHQYITTPFGTYPVNASPEQQVEIETAVAAAMGFPNAGPDIAKGVAAGIATGQQIGAQALADAQKKFGMDPSRGLAGNAAGGGSADGSSKTAQDDSAKDKPVTKTLLNPQAFLPPDEKTVDWDERARRLAADREKLGQQLGFTPIWKKDDDIFKKVHDHYQALRSQNIFFEETAPVAVIDKSVFSQLPK